jgi:hypothetical protein
MIAYFWVFTQCSVIDLFWRFRRTCFRHLQRGWAWFRWILKGLEGKKYDGWEGSLEETFTSQQHVAGSNQISMHIVKPKIWLTLWPKTAVKITKTFRLKSCRLSWNYRLCYTGARKWRSWLYKRQASYWLASNYSLLNKYSVPWS